MLYLLQSPKTRVIAAFLGLLFTGSQAIAQESAAPRAPETELKEAVLERPANIVYPSALQQWQQHSIGHVEEYARKRRERFFDIARNGKKYFPSIVKTLSKYELPEELKVLIALESDFNPNVVSWAGAVGYWQFMDQTAREYGLNIISKEEREAELKPKETLVKSRGKKAAVKEVKAVTAVKKQPKKKDDRKNLAKSTRAAARYLGNSYQLFNEDILLTVASYNCGPGNVKKAQERSGIQNATFWDIKECLPAETRNYVMNFIALNVLLKNYDALRDKTLRFRPETMKVSEMVAGEQPASPVATETDTKEKE